MELGELLFTLLIDDKQFMAGIDKSKKAVQNFSSAVAKDGTTIRSSFKLTSDTTAVWGKASEKVTATLDGLKNKQLELKTAMDSAQKSGKLTSSVVEEYNKKYQALGTAISDISKKYVHFDSATGALTAKQTELKNEIINLTAQGVSPHSKQIKTLKKEYDEVGLGITNLTHKSRSFSEQLASISKTATIVGVVLTATVTRAIIKLSESMIKYASDLQFYQASFEVMLGSAAKATKVIDDLRVMAAKTPFEMKDLTSGARTLVQFGETADTVMKTVQVLGDIAQGNNERFQALSLAYAQMSSAGRLLAQDLYQMVNAGFNPLLVMSEKTGRSLMSLREDMKKGLITTEMVKEAFYSAAEAGGKFYQGMERASKTLKGLTSTLKDDVQQMGKTFTDVFMNDVMNLVKGLSEVAKWIGGLNSGLKAFIGTMGLAAAAIGPLITAIGALGVAWTFFKKTNPELFGATLVITAILGIASALVGVAVAAREVNKQKVFSDVGEQLREAVEAGKQLSDVIEEVAAYTGLTVSKVIELARAEGLVTEKNEEQIEKLEKANEQYDKLKGSVEDVAKKASEITAQFNNLYQRNGDVLAVVDRIASALGVSRLTVAGTVSNSKLLTEEHKLQLETLKDMTLEYEKQNRAEQDKRKASGVRTPNEWVKINAAMEQAKKDLAAISSTKSLEDQAKALNVILRNLDAVNTQAYQPIYQQVLASLAKVAERQTDLKQNAEDYAEAVGKADSKLAKDKLTVEEQIKNDVLKNDEEILKARIKYLEEYRDALINIKVNFPTMWTAEDKTALSSTVAELEKLGVSADKLEISSKKLENFNKSLDDYYTSRKKLESDVSFGSVTKLQALEKEKGLLDTLRIAYEEYGYSSTDAYSSIVSAIRSISDKIKAQTLEDKRLEAEAKYRQAVKIGLIQLEERSISEKEFAQLSIDALDLLIKTYRDLELTETQTYRDLRSEQALLIGSLNKLLTDAEIVTIQLRTAQRNAHIEKIKEINDSEKQESDAIELSVANENTKNAVIKQGIATNRALKMEQFKEAVELEKLLGEAVELSTANESIRNAVIQQGIATSRALKNAQFKENTEFDKQESDAIELSTANEKTKNTLIQQGMNTNRRLKNAQIKEGVELEKEMEAAIQTSVAAEKLRTVVIQINREVNRKLKMELFKENVELSKQEESAIELSTASEKTKNTLIQQGVATNRALKMEQFKEAVELDKQEEQARIAKLYEGVAEQRRIDQLNATRSELLYELQTTDYEKYTEVKKVLGSEATEAEIELLEEEVEAARKANAERIDDYFTSESERVQAALEIEEQITNITAEQLDARKIAFLNNLKDQIRVMRLQGKSIKSIDLFYNENMFKFDIATQFNGLLEDNLPELKKSAGKVFSNVFGDAFSKPEFGEGIESTIRNLASIDLTKISEMDSTQLVKMLFVLKELTNELPNGTTAQKKFIDEGNKVVTTIGHATEVVDGFTKAISGVINTNYEDVFSGLMESAAGIASMFGPEGQMIASITRGMSAFQNVMKNMVTALVGDFEKIQENEIAMNNNLMEQKYKTSQAIYQNEIAMINKAMEEELKAKGLFDEDNIKKANVTLAKLNIEYANAADERSRKEIAARITTAQAEIEQYAITQSNQLLTAQNTLAELNVKYANAVSVREKAEIDAQIKEQQAIVSKYTIMQKYSDLSADAEKEFQKAQRQYNHDKAISDKALARAQAEMAHQKAIADLGIGNKDKKAQVDAAYAKIFEAIDAIPIPALATGGIALPKNNGQIARIAEKGIPEAIIPLNRINEVLSNISQTQPIINMSEMDSGDIHLVVNIDSKPILQKIFPASRNRTVLIDSGAVV